MGEDRPHADVELAPAVQQRSLNVLLNHPVGVLWFCGKKSNDVAQILENLNSAPLVHCRGLYKPNVVLAMLLWDALLHREAVLRELLVARNELVVLVALERRRNNESRRRRIEHCVAAIHALHVLLVIRLE